MAAVPQGDSNRVLILAPTGKDAALAQTILGRADVACLICNDLDEVRAALDSGAGALLLAEEAVAESGKDRLAMLIRSQPPWSDLPVLVLARPRADSATVARAMHLLGNVTVLERPARVATVVSAVRTALRARQRQYEMRAYLEERKRSEEALRDSESRFRELANNIDQFAWTCDELGFMTWVNRRWFDYTGATFDEMRGDGWRKYVHPEHVDRVWAGLVAMRSAAEPWEDTFPLRARDGEHRWFLSRAVPIRDRDGRVLRWLGTNTDVTEQLHLEQALRDADRRKDEFLAVLAHELRNPLAPVRNSLRILRLNGGQEPMSRRATEMIERQVNVMVRLVDDLLEVSRITRDKLELRREAIEMAAVIGSAVETSRPLVDAARLRLTLKLPREPLRVEGDPVRLAQVFSNLLNNATKYTEPGGEIVLTMWRDGNQVAASVRDTGVGIPTEMLPRVFDLFTQVERSTNRSQGGLGIGLTLVKRLVEMHGGTVTASSGGAGTGSEFVVRLPLPMEPVAFDVPASVPRGLRQGLRVVVADDNRDAATSMGELLRLLGAEVHVVFGGIEALAAVQEWIPDVALLDIGMPGLNGHEVAQRIRLEPQLRDVVLVALTGWGQDDDRALSRSVGFDHHLTKPADLETLCELLDGKQAGSRMPARPSVARRGDRAH